METSDARDTIDDSHQIVPVAKLLLDEIAQRISHIYRSLDPLEGFAQGAGHGFLTGDPASFTLRNELEEEVGAVLRLLETLGADMPYPAPPSKETLAREARMRRDPRIWSETISRLKNALPHGITPEPGESADP